MDLAKAIKILELQDFSGVEGIKKNFRGLAHKLHPDKNLESCSPEDFDQLVRAYEYVLANLTEVYRHFGSKPSREEEVAAKVLIQNTNDIFDDIFGFSKKGRVLGYQEPEELFLTIEQFALGATIERKLTAYESCPDCKGLGAPSGASAKICPYCFGRGMLGPTKLPVAEESLPCQKCLGRGRLLSQHCERCNGFGRLKVRRRFCLTVPVGFRPFEVYNLEGRDAATGKVAEVFVRPRPEFHRIFQIANCDLLCQYCLDLAGLARDLTVKVATPLGSVVLAIAKDTKNGDVITVRGAGIYTDSQKRSRGDLKVTIAHKPTVFFKRVWWWLLNSK